MDGVSLAASVLAIATAGVQISIKLVSFSNQVATAPSRIRSIGSDVSTTSNVLQQLSELMTKREGQEAISIFSDDGLQNTQASAGACQTIFVELEDALRRCSKQLSERSGSKLPAAHITLSKLEALKWPFLQPEINSLHTELKGARDNLMLILQVTTLAYSRKLAELNQPPILTVSENSLIIGAIVALHDAKSNAVSSPLDDAACEEIEEEQPNSGGSGSVPFSKDVVDDKPENPSKSVLNSDVIRKGVLLEASGHVTSLVNKSDSISNSSVAKTPVGSPPNRKGNKQLPQKGSGRLSTMIHSWRRKSAIFSQKQYPDRPASDTAREQDFGNDTQNTTGPMVANMKNVNKHNSNSVAAPHSQCSATIPKGRKRSETNSTTWEIKQLSRINPLMEIWEIEPMLDERSLRHVYYTVRHLPLEQNDIKRSLRRSRRWKRVDNVKQYAKLLPEERDAIDRRILQNRNLLEDRRIIGIVIRKISIPNDAFIYVPKRQVLVFARRYIFDAPDTEVDVNIKSSLPDRPVPRIDTGFDDYLAERRSNTRVYLDRYHSPEDRRHDRSFSHERELPIRGGRHFERRHRDKSRTPSPVDPELEERLQRLANLERTEYAETARAARRFEEEAARRFEEEEAARRFEEEKVIEEAKKAKKGIEEAEKAKAFKIAQDERGVGATVKPIHVVDEVLDNRQDESDDGFYEHHEKIIEPASRDHETPREAAAEQIVDALLAKYTTIRP